MPPYLQLVHQVRQSLLLGYLREGDRLPAVEDVAGDLAPDGAVIGLVVPNGPSRDQALAMARINALGIPPAARRPVGHRQVRPE